MSQPDPGDRLVRQLPPDGVRRILARRDSMTARGEAGEVARLELDAGGCWKIVVQEVYLWRSKEGE